MSFLLQIRTLWRGYSLYLLMMTAVVLLALAEPLSGQWLRFDRMALVDGQWWRLLSASWVHLSWQHALGNMAGIALFAYIAGPSLNSWRGLLLLSWCVAVVGCGLYWFATDLYGYAGLSGALHGLLLVAPFVSPFYSRRIAWLFFVVIVAKVIWEQTSWYNDMALADVIGGRVETRSHLLGTLAGMFFLLQIYWRRLLRLAPAD
ncbi:rhombosortase [Thalassolituus hydrocarboniclasticus]|uniref:Rhombosortase n=1 Tax=Thalassolituus hydrocarboniclasticus TaxID=2742796 RepID=A0ABY6A8H2_9GAMM|nr:rhombosortase [Thalassolituus hydrocarboniclasticus]UXD87088.1 rhombosortase [Thalassolituus hydrocarboniclasticus]